MHRRRTLDKALDVPWPESSGDCPSSHSCPGLVVGYEHRGVVRSEASFMFRSSARLTAGPLEIEVTPPPSERAGLELRQLRRLEIASALEASTLLLLVCVAVPLKHLACKPAMVSAMGPIHGLAFAFYAWTVVETVAGGGWSRRDTSRLALAALVPFGGFANLGWLRRRAAALQSAGA